MDAQTASVVETVRGSAKHGAAALSNLNESTLNRLKQQALDSARKLQQQAVQTAAESAAVARDVAASGTTREAGTKLWLAGRKLSVSTAAVALARTLVCIYFLNLCVDDFEIWGRNNTKGMREQWALYELSGGFSRPKFPWLEAFVLMPCSFGAALGIKVPWTATALVVDMLYDSANLVITQILLFLFWGQTLNELAVKKLAMLGCALLVLAHSVKDRIAANSYAGLLLKGDPSKRQAGWFKSIVLLLGRLFMAALFIFVGCMQLQRVAARDYILYVQHDVRIPLEARRDGHDNNWLLLEFVFALPFAVGWKTEWVSRLLAATMIVEAFNCWGFWGEHPSWQYAAHVRSHFFTNLGVAGGLLLLQTFGPGRYSVDAVLKAKKKN
mmetsp:Transcript_14227/g.42975  ORF Transcript_14227/g.42975 Transcript_14227/m.42975 type:complete len:384 (-) Transcript_14227:2002-3153(-)